MSNIVDLLKMIAVLVAAILVGNWFLSEIKEARLKDKPWYQPYVSIPGVLIVLALLLPILLWVVGK